MGSNKIISKIRFLIFFLALLFNSCTIEPTEGKFSKINLHPKKILVDKSGGVYIVKSSIPFWEVKTLRDGKYFTLIGIERNITENYNQWFTIKRETDSSFQLMFLENKSGKEKNIELMIWAGVNVGYIKIHQKK